MSPCLFGGCIFWVPRYYLTVRINISKDVFLQPVNNAEVMVKFTRFIRRLHGTITQPLRRLERWLFGALCSFGSIGMATNWHSLSRETKSGVCKPG